MPNIKSAEKQQRIALKRRAINKTNTSKTKTAVKKAEESIASGDLQKATEDIKVAASTLDKAAGKGIIHANNAARHKSRLEKRLNKTKAAASK
ncbi:MAG: 30S ribosomal protein S20 [Dehalococcoidales bacterium]|nr:30S ribosomal protein S20 [Dehalococcoidales bacterium]